ncbi:MAG TPA: acyl-CoA-binding protein [Burkholderiaceae bacterium]|jgi:acyl-CoA-binding protein|nr:acyl-CoA-binding protein [Burkholderiaceae bacterium]
MSALDDAFQQAVAASKQLPERPDNATLLRIYGLYKQATEGDASGDAPGATDFVGRAKWGAWQARQGLAAEQAKQEYIDLIAGLQ